MLTSKQYEEYHEQIIEKIEVTKTCWNWIGSIRPDGYGSLHTKMGHKMAHRLVYEILIGEIPKEMILHHKCHNLLCVNPSHLVPMTQSENAKFKKKPQIITKYSFQRKRRDPHLTRIGIFGKIRAITDKIKFTDGCHIWTGAKNQLGYGRITIFGKSKQAHRVIYELVKGPIPEGLVLDHKCKNPSCVNTEHLEPVSQLENVRRGLVNQNKQKTHCKYGHKFTPKNTAIDKNGRRNCRQCHRNKSNKLYLKKHTHCTEGHKYTLKNIYRDKANRRYCKECKKNGKYDQIHTHCHKGHEFTQENTYIYEKTGQQCCRKCQIKRSEKLEKLNKILNSI